jgi:ATP-dependent Lhr-like helicase
LTGQPSDRQAALNSFHAVLRRWFVETFDAPTAAQAQAWPLIAAGRHTLVLAPTGSGKTLAAFLVAINRILFEADRSPAAKGVRVLYISPLKALGVDVERNLRGPLAGVRAVADRESVPYHALRIGVRSGDTASADRYRLNREPPEILITTPESLYLILTSQARRILQTVETVIVDEIHSIAGTKRGAHLFVSLERLEQLRRGDEAARAPCQRIGLSATQRPLTEIARLLGGAEATADPNEPPRLRPVEIVEAGRGKQLELRIEVPVEDMARLAEPQLQSGNAAAGPSAPSLWPAIHPRLVALIRQHRATMIFVNSRRLAERLAAAINEVAGEELALAHHGSIAKDTRLQIEDRLKRGQLPAIVATSSLELGIDMGAVDLVVQIEAPPSIASGIQRIGRAGHQVGVPSTGVIFPKYRGDLLACSAATERMVDGAVEETYYPRNPLDVLAQQLVAMAALGLVSVDQLYRTVRGAAPFHELPRTAFEGVLDLLAGRYPSDEFSALRPRVTWDRLAGTVTPRPGTQRVAILNAGTIPDRGLYGVFLADENGPRSRVGELDEEMVFETHVGDVFLLGASSWRVLDITNDRVLVSPAPGEPGKMPFWHGEGPGRPLEFGRAIGALTRTLLRLPPEEASQRLARTHALDPWAAQNLLRYLREQAAATGEAPSDKTIVIECFLDEVGDWRIVILSHFGARIHAPWAIATAARLREETPGEVDLMWTDDGIVFRLPESDEPPPGEWLVPSADEVEHLVVRELGGTSLFAARFRENAARALLLPRRSPGKRMPLWVQRRRAADLLTVAARYPGFPILLETYRECLRDVFDIRGLQEVLQAIERRAIRVHQVQTQSASPFAASLLFNYAANFIYEGDAPLAERRAQTLSLDLQQLRELLGDAELRELLDPQVVDELAGELQRLDGRFPLKHADGLHELLQHLGDLRHDELAARTDSPAVSSGALDRWLAELVAARRVIEVRIAGEPRYAAAEDAGRLRDGLGAMPPAGLPAAFLEVVDDPLGDLVSRYARTHVPFHAEDVARRLGLGVAPVRNALERLAARHRVLEGEFLPRSCLAVGVSGRLDAGSTPGREWCDAEVLRTLKRRSLAKLRKQVEPVETLALARFLPRWQGVTHPGRGLDGVLDAVEHLQGLPLPATALERDILPARVHGYRPNDLDELCAAGEIVWRGFESLGPGDGRVALYLTDHLLKLAPEPASVDSELAGRIRNLLAERGAVFFEDLAAALGGFRHDLSDALWELVWAGTVTNDTLTPLRSLRRARPADRRRHTGRGRSFRSRRTVRLPGTEGRWSLLVRPDTTWPSPTERQTAIAAQLVQRYGVLTREMVAREGVTGGFAGLYPVLRAMEAAGRIRRGYFVAGLGAAQFAAPGADERLRQREPAESDEPDVLVLAATDPANPYGTALPWPETPHVPARPQRAAGARVILDRGALCGYLGRTGRHLTTFLPETEPERGRTLLVLARALAGLSQPGAPVYLTQIDDRPPSDSPLAESLRAAGFTATTRGYLHRHA